MKTAIDASVLWCLLNEEADAARWRMPLERAARAGELVICPVPLAEISPAYDSEDDLMDDMDRLTITLDPIGSASSWKAGQIFKSYRKAGGPRPAAI